MFLIQKFISFFILSPVPFILIIFLIGISNIKDRKFKSGFLLFILSGTLYLFSCEFFADPIILNLEKRYPIIEKENIEKGEVYILLGGGIITNTLDGNIPTKNASVRIMKTLELYNKNPKKIYISGGSPLQNKESESSVYKRELILLGVPSEDIIIEEKSNTTKENSEYIKKMMMKNNIHSGILITSAIHMPRSMNVFEDSNLVFYPAPCDFLAHQEKQNNFSYMPQFKVFKDLYSAFWEYVGIFYYKIKHSLSK